VGIIFSVFVIVLYHFEIEPKVFLEGMENASSDSSDSSDSLPKKPTIPPVSSTLPTTPAANTVDDKATPADKSTPVDISTATPATKAKAAPTKATTAATTKATTTTTTTTEGYENIRAPLTPFIYGKERDNIIRLEKMMRPRSSHSFMMVEQGNTIHVEPDAYYYGKNAHNYAYASVA